MALFNDLAIHNWDPPRTAAALVVRWFWTSYCSLGRINMQHDYKKSAMRLLLLIIYCDVLLTNIIWTLLNHLSWCYLWDYIMVLISNLTISGCTPGEHIGAALLCVEQHQTNGCNELNNDYLMIYFVSIVPVRFPPCCKYSQTSFFLDLLNLYLYGFLHEKILL